MEVIVYALNSTSSAPHLDACALVPSFTVSRCERFFMATLRQGYGRLLAADQHGFNYRAHQPSTTIDPCSCTLRRVAASDRRRTSGMLLESS